MSTEASPNIDGWKGRRRRPSRYVRFRPIAVIPIIPSVVLDRRQKGAGMGRPEKLGYAAAILLMAVQTVAIYADAGILGLLVPALLAALAAAVSTYRYQNASRVKPKLHLAFIPIVLFAAITMCLFIFAPAEPSVRFQIMRALGLDATTLLTACILALQLYHRRPRTA